MWEDLEGQVPSEQPILARQLDRGIDPLPVAPMVGPSGGPPDTSTLAEMGLCGWDHHLQLLLEKQRGW